MNGWFITFVLEFWLKFRKNYNYRILVGISKNWERFSAHCDLNSKFFLFCRKYFFVKFLWKNEKILKFWIFKIFKNFLIFLEKFWFFTFFVKFCIFCIFSKNLKFWPFFQKKIFTKISPPTTQKNIF